MNSVLLFSRARECASTYNQLNKLFISAERRFTLEEIREIRNFLNLSPSTGDRKIAEQTWIKFFNRHVVSIKKPKSFVSNWHRKSASSYTLKNPSQVRKLVVGFAGRNNRMMMPDWAFLASMPNGVTDVLILRIKWDYEKTRECYPAAMKDIDILVNSHIEQLKPEWKATFGLSIGSLPALLYGLKNNFDRIALVSPISDSDEYFPEEFQLTAGRLESFDSSAVRVLASVRDKPAVSQLKWIKDRFPRTKVFLYLDPDHGLLTYLLRRGRLEKGMRKLLGS